MAIKFEEKNNSRSFKTGENSDRTLIYTLQGTSDDAMAEEYALAHVPASHGGLDLQGVEAEPEWVDESTDSGVWTITARYGQKTPPEVGETSFSFDTTGGTQHRTQAIKSIARYAPTSRIARNFHGAIGVTNDSVEGVDVPLRVFNFTIRKRIPKALWTASYVRTLYYLSATVNTEPFSVTINGETMTFPAGELLFYGATGDESSNSEFVEVSYKFAASPNMTDITIGDEDSISGIEKKGWEYMWVRYEDSVDEGAKAIVKKPVGAYIEQVIEEGDHNLLGTL